MLRISVKGLYPVLKGLADKFEIFQCDIHNLINIITFAATLHSFYPVACADPAGSDSLVQVGTNNLVRRVMRKGQHFARAFKRAVAVEYLQSGEERKVIAMKYGLPNVQTISNWVSLYLTPHEIETKCVNLPRINVNAVEMSKVETPQPQVPLEDQQAVIAQLQKQLQKLEKQLQFEKDRNYALNTLIDIAEEQGIKIRKKSGVKR